MTLFLIASFVVYAIAFCILMFEIANYAWPKWREPKTLAEQVVQALINLAFAIWSATLLFF